ncbi:MAG: Uncharacterised protein [Cryomorphaceae bacterium]|nr:MAG: Uncharacterised protein [Cryomorphaceae bacterium]
MRSNIKASSFTKEMFTSLCAFSIALEASATLIDGAKCVPAVIIDLYSSSTFFAVAGLEPEVTFLIVEIVFILSPGLMRSGE